CASSDAGSSNAIIHTTRKHIRRIANSYLMRADRPSARGFAIASSLQDVATYRERVRLKRSHGWSNDREAWRPTLTKPFLDGRGLGLASTRSVGLVRRFVLMCSSARITWRVPVRCSTARVLRLLATTAQAPCTHSN
ncbi:hypothetical protein, partial [Xanthomonas perforans]|uniref:hypothetical protein n=1 Tax=Xanthomonas perforans TaxID=442694 RepID=UPI0019D0443C